MIYPDPADIGGMSGNVIPSVEDVKKIAGIPVFEVFDDLEWMEGPVMVDNNDIASVLEFAKAVGAKAMFVQYDYPDFDDYYIDPDEFDIEDIFGEDAADDVYDAIEDHNDDFEDFLENDYDNEPFACSVYVMYEGTPYGMYVEDDELIESFGESGYEFLVRKYIEAEDEENGN